MPVENVPVVAQRSGFMRIWRRGDVSLDSILDAIAAPGERLKQNDKSLTKRAGGLVVKSSGGNLALQCLKHTFHRERYRRGWRAALHLERHNVPAPRFVAHVEWGTCGACWRHATIAEYVRGCLDVERFYDTMAGRGATHDERAAYLHRLAEAVDRLANSGAIHTDLAGKNILTPDGAMFYFIDLDGVVLGEAFDETHRFRQHVQLYDSFIDRCGDELLVPFLKRMLPVHFGPFDPWLARVKAAQAGRRARTVAIWDRKWD